MTAPLQISSRGTLTLPKKIREKVGLAEFKLFVVQGHPGRMNRRNGLVIEELEGRSRL
jgi:bifunctional DNA-binding transcriptional regulator/antitoxin component of YhaV-PrlF toxin-antitoxin module